MIVYNFVKPDYSLIQKNESTIEGYFYFFLEITPTINRENISE